jgi:glycosyltransferase involved in cell wall biosynthesis
MRIIYLHQYFNTPAQSGGTRSYEMARRLVAHGHEVTMITSDRAGQGSRVREEMIEGIKVLWIPVAYDNSMSYARRMRAFVSFAIRSAQLARSVDCDIIFATSTPLTIAIPAMYAARRRRVPWVLEVRDLWPELPIAVGAIRNPLVVHAAFALARRAYRSAAAVVALSPGMRDGVVAQGAAPERVSVIPNFCDLSRFDPNKASKEPFMEAHPELRGRRLAIYAGQIGKINGLEYVLDMANESSRPMPDLAFVLIGRGSEVVRLETHARERGLLGKNVFFLPPVPKEAMPHVLAAADIALGIFRDVPGMETNSSNKFFDALAAGRPVAINYGGWHAEVLHEFGSGVRLPGGDAAQAASVLTRFLADEKALARAASGSRQVAEQRFNVESLAGQLEAILSTVECRSVSGTD